MAGICLGRQELNRLLLTNVQKGDLGFLDWRVLYPNPHPGSCSASNVFAGIVFPDGGVYKCYETVGMEEDLVAHVGSPNRIRTNVLSKWVSVDAFSEDCCVECKVLPLCLGGCPREWLARRGPACIGIKHNLREWIAVLGSLLISRKVS